MTYPQAIQFLYDLRWFGTKFGLANTLKLAALAGNPQRQLRFIHVAGTNGKGSTCAMLESIYRQAGLKVGLFTSPHLVAFGERIQINRQLISEAEIVRLVQEMQPLLQQFPREEHPTFFEVVTVMALRYFAAQGCELVIWETGMGGRLDATNIVMPLASLITNIQFDHQKWLGNTLAAIASEKAGIIKPGVPILTGSEAPEALEVIARTASQQKAPFERVGLSQTHEPPLDTLALPLAGEHQKRNAALAVATVRVLQSVIPVSDAALREGLLRVRWEGRLQWVERPSGQRLLLDGAHNIASARTLVETLRALPSFPAQGPSGELTLVLGILADKDWAPMCELLAPLANRILVVPVHSERTAQPGVIAEACRRANPKAQVREYASLAGALPDAAQAPWVVIAGSLYLVGEAIELLKLSPVRNDLERELNHWSGVPQPAGSTAA